MSNIIVLYVRPYDLIDENTGERKSGLSVHYVDSTSFFHDEQNGFGCPIFKSSLPKPDSGNLKDIFKEVPGLYTPNFSTYMAKGQRCSKLSNVQFIKGIDLWTK